MTQDGPLRPAALTALRARFDAQSCTAQAYETVMHAVRGMFGGNAAASSSMEAPSAAFEGRTPAQLVGEGRAQALLDHLGAMK